MLFSRYERMIARRYLLPGRGEAFIAVVAGFSLVAVMLGVAALIVVMSVLNGFRNELFDKITGLNGHAVVQGYNGQLRDWREVVRDARATPGVTSAIPLIEQPLFSAFKGRVEFSMVRGMRLEDIQTNPTLKGKEVLGSFADLKPGSERVAIGTRLAQALGATIGSEITIINPSGATTPFGTMFRSVSYRVTAIFEVGLYDYDKSYIIMPIEDAQTLLLLGDAVSMVEIDTDDPDRIGEILLPLRDKVEGRGQITDWQRMNQELYQAMSVDRVVTSTVVAIILIVASFNIFSSLIMLVRSKSRDIAVMRTMGATRGAVMRIFVTVGTTIGALGIVAGALLAGLIIHFRAYVVKLIGFVTGQNIWDPEFRFLTELPADPNMIQVIVICLVALLCSFLATLVPAWMAAKTDPVQVLRYE